MTVTEIRIKISALQDELARYIKALKALQDICEHNWYYDGHGHNDSYYVCTLCGKEKSE